MCSLLSAVFVGNIVLSVFYAETWICCTIISNKLVFIVRIFYTIKCRLIFCKYTQFHMNQSFFAAQPLQVHEAVGEFSTSFSQLY